MKKSILIFSAILFLSSCKAPKILKYQKSIKDTTINITTKEDAGSLLQISAFVLDPSTLSNKTITDLSDKGQAALIEALSSKSTTAKELMSSIALPIKESVSGNIKGSKLWKKQIVLNVLKTDDEKANRIEQILFTMDIPQNLIDKVEFVNWNKIVTETQIIDLGKITSGNSTTLSFSPEITMAGTIQGKAPGSVSNTKTFNQERSFSSRLAGLNASLVSGSKFQVLRKGIANEDISGNIVVEITLKSKFVKEVPIYEFSGFYNGTSIVTDQSKIGMIKNTLVRPDFGDSNINIPIDLTYKFRFRKVNHGINTEPEYDDCITYIGGEITEKSKFKIFDKEESEKTKTWEISDGFNYLHVSKTGLLEQLIFDSPVSAGQLLSWIKQTQNLKVSDYDLFKGTVPLSLADIKNLKVVITE
ncbi:hypothetical protein [Flavobacterium sp. ASV13]|uniref:hypothetical protein n=1 Tax=Flavobacterium sp. ASV13 TaxID=1506583 RepID=UPI00054F5F5A|nr:hypothetical protein [Flavobacterium sp. ASV13]